MRQPDPSDGSLGNVTAFAYDAMNNQIRECLSGEEGETCVTLYRYDKLGRMIKEINPLLDEKTYVYDGNGNVISILDEDGNETTVRYDLNNRPAGMCYSDGREALFRYNKRGELVEMQDWNGTAVMEYGRTGRLQKTTDHNGYTAGYEYDANGNITGITYPDGSAASYAFDKNNRMIKAEGAEGKAAAYRYDPMGNIASIQLPGSVSSYTYNQKGLPVKAAYQFDDGTLMEESYSYDAMGALLARRGRGMSLTCLREPLMPMMPWADSCPGRKGCGRKPTGTTPSGTGRQKAWTEPPLLPASTTG